MEEKLKVLMISSDRKLFEDGSAVSERIKEYGALVNELHIVVLAKSSLNFKEKKIGSNIWIYSTNSSSRWLYVHDASHIGKRIVLDHKFVRGQSLISTQDPFECGLAGLKIRNKWRLPLEVQLHTDPFSQYFSGFINFLRKRIARKVLSRAQGIRVVSQSLSKKISNITKVQINVLPIYIDRERIENGQVSFDLHARFGWHFVLLAVSRLSSEKNIDLAIKILSLVRQSFPDTGLVIVGSGPEEGHLKKLVKSLNLEKNVAFVGWQEDLASYYKTANAFIQTSLFEGYGLSLVEAGLYGLPVITTPVGIAEELGHGHDAYIYPASSQDIFAGGVIDLIENNHKREFLRENLKNTLESKLLSKSEYLLELKKNWESTAIKIKT